MSVKKFNLQLKKEIAATDELVEDKIISIGLDAFRRIVLKAPVDTGRFRGNWIVSKNTFNNTTNQITDKSGGRTITKGNKVIETFEYKKDKSIIMQNNLSYANVLENGSSKKAPQGIVAPTIVEIQRAYRNVLI